MPAHELEKEVLMQKLEDLYAFEFLISGATTRVGYSDRNRRKQLVAALTGL